jgi:hypothetical protein
MTSAPPSTFPRLTYTERDLLSLCEVANTVFTITRYLSEAERDRLSAIAPLAVAEVGRFRQQLNFLAFEFGADELYAELVDLPRRGPSLARSTDWSGEARLNDRAFDEWAAFADRVELHMGSVVLEALLPERVAELLRLPELPVEPT